MKYVIGAIILSLGAMLVLLAVLMAIQIDKPENLTQILGAVWLGLAVVMYPVARKIVR